MVTIADPDDSACVAHPSDAKKGIWYKSLLFLLGCFLFLLGVYFQIRAHEFPINSQDLEDVAAAMEWFDHLAQRYSHQLTSVVMFQFGAPIVLYFLLSEVPRKLESRRNGS